MTKMQKVWLWIFLAMFIVPEVLWGGLASTFLNLNPILNLSGLFENHPIAANAIILPEMVGILGLMILNQKYPYRNQFFKYFVTAALLLALLGLCLLIYIAYSFSKMSLP